MSVGRVVSVFGLSFVLFVHGVCMCRLFCYVCRVIVDDVRVVCVSVVVAVM